MSRVEAKPVSLASQRSFWFLMFAQVSEQIADSLNLIIVLAALLAAYHGEANPAGDALFGPMFLPVLLLGPFAGIFVDRGAKRSMLLAAAVGRGLLIAGMAVVTPALVAGSRWALGGMMLCIFLISSLWQFYNPARSAALPEVVPPDQLDVANSVSVTILLVMQIIGYLIGGLLGDNFNLAHAFWINSACYGLTTFFLLFVRFHPPAENHRFEKLTVRSVRTELVKSLKALLSPRLRVRVAALNVVVVLVAAGLAFPNLKDFTARLAFPPFMDRVDAWIMTTYGLHVGPLTRFTLLLLAGAAGAGLGIVLLGWLKRKIRQMVLIQSSLLVCGVFIVFLPSASSFALASLFMAGVGLGGVLVKALTEARLQQRIPVYMRGKVLSAYFMACGAAVVGGAALPGLFEKVFSAPGPVIWLRACGVLVLGYGIPMSLWEALKAGRKP